MMLEPAGEEDEADLLRHDDDINQSGLPAALYLLFTARRNAKHCKRCTCYSNSVCPSVRHTPVLCQNDGT